MSRVLLVSTDSSFPQLNERWSIQQVGTLEEASACLDEPWVAMVADLRHGPSVERLLEWRGEDAPGCVVAVLPTGDGEAARIASTAGLAFVDGAWVSSGPLVLETYLGGVVEYVRRSAELATVRARQEQMIQNEKFAAVGLLAAEVAHEINNPSTFVITNLTVMIDYVQTIGQFHDDLRGMLESGRTIDQQAYHELEARHEIAFLGEDLDTLLDRSLAGLRRIHQIVQDLRYFGADRTTAEGLVDVDGLVRAAVNLVRHEARFRATMKVDLPGLPVIRSDANRLSQVILNVLVNAVQAIPPGNVHENRVTVAAEVSDEAVVLVVTDTGTGISDDLLERVFEPFFTTKAPGEGTGLGLAISRDIMQSLGGDIDASSTVGAGSRFEVRIPRKSHD